ncbi:hypothetical protein [Bradyrhizobium sp.]|uniref:hypothetical protein n=1 Tax=Bradyrhizobium sp. TaxID=376 RepID=UPI003BAFC1A4
MAASLPTASHAETGSVQVKFTKAALIVGFGTGRGMLTLRRYPFKISGISFGATFGASTNKMVGQALHLDTPGDIVGIYATVGAGGALAGGAGGVQLQNAKGVVLQLHGVKAGVELSANVGGVEITME